MDNSTLAASLRDARARQLSIFEDLSEQEQLGTQEHHLEPPIWEMGHVAWFQELYLLRQMQGNAAILSQGDSVYDSFNVSYKKRWSHDFPSTEETLSYAQEVLDRCLARLSDTPLSDKSAIIYQLAIAHEQMHTENLMAVRRQMHYGTSRSISNSDIDDGYLAFDVKLPGGEFQLGARRDRGFTLDNEQWAHPVQVAPFSISSTPVTNAEFAEFLDADAYKTRSLWTKDGWNWRRRSDIGGPLYWKKSDGQWLEHHYNEWQPIRPWHPVCHINLHEARAFCRFAGRRLPTEAEWEMAASFDPQTQEKRLFPWGDSPPDSSRVHMDLECRGTTDVRAKAAGDSALGCRQMVGNVWEWTSSKLVPYPGFEPGVYADYSQPYLGIKPVLRGGSWATHPGLIRNTWRNFFIKHRRNIFAGMRTCAL